MDIFINALRPEFQAYNFHTHTQYCDGRAPMEEIAEAAFRAGMKELGFTPHSPIPIASPCNMEKEAVKEYFQELSRLKDIYEGEGMRLYQGMEIDSLGSEWGPHVDYFQKLPLDFRIGSVHFVPTQDGRPVDCDGRFPRFEKNLREQYRGDIRYVVEKFFEEELRMIERGGFDVLGHFDKIGLNASQACPGIEEEGWYEALIDDVVDYAEGGGLIAEINTKSLEDFGRFFPHRKWWDKILRRGLPIIVNSDCHYPEKIELGRKEAFEALENDKKLYSAKG